MYSLDGSTLQDRISCSISTLFARALANWQIVLILCEPFAGIAKNLSQTVVDKGDKQKIFTWM